MLCYIFILQALFSVRSTLYEEREGFGPRLTDPDPGGPKPWIRIHNTAHQGIFYRQLLTVA
jgi:hypothetical protein